MSFDSHQTLYDVLDLRPDASPQEIREAYLKTKSAYTKDSLALYTLISAGEREDMLRRIEGAYEILSNPDRRRVYDQSHGTLFDSSVVSIDRVPPMDTSMPSRDADNLLVPPSTEIPIPSAFAPEAPDPFITRSEAKAVVPPPIPKDSRPLASVSPPAPPVETIPWDQIVGADPSEWTGVMLRQIREARKMSLEEMANVTKISKTYLAALEDENFTKLPAPVFVRGFVTQVAKTLRLPIDPVSASYMSRYQRTSAG